MIDASRLTKVPSERMALSTAYTRIQGPDRIAVEVYPPKESVVDVAEMRWIWVLPKGAILPFNLQSTSREKLVS